jgi:uncharacterized small protein (DUF1192 family)
MTIERTNDEIIVRLPGNMDFESLQSTIDLLTVTELKSRSVATQEDIDRLVREVKKGWWAKNRSRFIK